LLAAAGIVAVAALFVLFRSPAPPSSPEPSAPPVAAEAPPPAPPAPPAPRIARAPERAAAPMGGSPPEPAPAAEEAPPAPDSADAPTVPSGIGLFPPRGSDPVRVGIVVPEDFALPDGFMRHYQVTDDGQDVAPILVVHPDYELLDARGHPVPRPEGGVVPPELAPKGMPVETVVIPDPLDESAP